MAKVESSSKPMFSLRLLVDKSKNKVVLAEACKEFVDVIFSFLTLPMGTIVRVLEKYHQEQKSQASTIGCFNNLYKSVTDVGTASFMTKACQDMLLNPRSVDENKRRLLKLNVDDTEVLKYYTCTNSNCSNRAYSDFRSSLCSCGAKMEGEIKFHESQSENYGIFFSDKSLFTITDSMKVESTSSGFTLRTLKVLGYTDVSQLHEMLVDVDHRKVVALLQAILISDTPLTDVFLMKRSSRAKTKMPSPVVQEVTGGESKSNEVITVSVITRKLDRKVLYVESEKEFVDFLFTLLVLPLSSAWRLSGSNILLGCIGNLFESFKRLSPADMVTEKCQLPWCYTCEKPLFDVFYATRKCFFSYRPVDPKVDIFSIFDHVLSGFVKRRTFIVSDDLTISPINISSTICSLMKLNIDLDDIEEHVIKISKTEAIKLLRATLMTSTPLNTVFGNLLPKKPKEEKL